MRLPFRHTGNRLISTVKSLIAIRADTAKVNASATSSKPSPSNYQKVFDSRKCRVRGLWQRNGSFQADLMVADDLGCKTSRWAPTR